MQFLTPLFLEKAMDPLIEGFGKAEAASRKSAAAMKKIASFAENTAATQKRILRLRKEQRSADNRLHGEKAKLIRTILLLGHAIGADMIRYVSKKGELEVTLRITENNGRPMLGGTAGIIGTKYSCSEVADVGDFYTIANTALANIARQLKADGTDHAKDLRQFRKLSTRFASLVKK